MNAEMNRTDREVCIGHLEEIPPGEGRAYLVEGRRIAIFRARGGTVYATQHDCPHQQGPLAEGVLGGCQLVCPLHGWKFDLETGACLTGSAPEGLALRTYPARAAAGRVLVTVPGADAESVSLFGFERDLLPALQCIPMVVRYKLDIVGLKVSLKAWNRLPREQRLALLERWPVETEAERTALRATLGDWLRAASDEPLRELLDEEPAWRETARLPEVVAAEGSRCRPPLAAPEWASLELLERFALVKLARAKHERGRFGAALAEFRARGGGGRSGGPAGRTMG